MLNGKINLENFHLPNGFILFISGVPGVGKTTISYELLKQFHDFRIIEETDILRDALRGYNELIVEQLGQTVKMALHNLEIYDNTKLLSFTEAKQQCLIMKNAIENIVMRQQRKGISSIINGVHIVPETLKYLADGHKIIFINLYISDEKILRKRLENRDPKSYMLQHIPFIYQSNNDLFLSTEKLVYLFSDSFYNIDVTALSITETILKITKIICAKFQNE